MSSFEDLIEKALKCSTTSCWKLFIDLRTIDRIKTQEKDRFVLNPDQTYGI